MMPSYFPPVGWVSRWLPMAIGGNDGSRPGRRAKMLPMSSTVTVHPAASHAARNQSRTWRSRSVNVSRQIPPFGVRADLRRLHDRGPHPLAVDRDVAAADGSAHAAGFLTQRIVRMMLPGQHAARLSCRTMVMQPSTGQPDAQIAADAFRVDHLIAPLPIHAQRGDRLVRGVLAADMAQAAFDAQLLVDPRDDLVVQVQVAPVHVVAHRTAAHRGDRRIALVVHPVRQARRSCPRRS